MASIKKLIATLSQRTAMYIRRNDIFCLQAFLNGCCFNNAETITDLHIIADFQDWVKNKFKVEHSQGWAAIILFHSLDERYALEYFFELFNEFLEETE
jgi:glutamine amidotransferase-like uncharacterized protein